MKAISAAGAALLLLLTCAKKEDTAASGMWGRTFEPRLSTTRVWHSCTREELSPGQAVVNVQCAAAPLLSGRCDEPIGSREEADRVLVSQPDCTDAAIAALEIFARRSAEAMSDLAAAFYVRAQRNDRPADLLDALRAAQRAVAVQPRPAGSDFNLALILEALSLDGAAAEAWQRAAATDGGPWAEEARRHRAALLRSMSVDGERQWARVRAAMETALDTGDVAQAARLVAQFPAASEKSFEEEVVYQWANSPTQANRLRVVIFADALSRFFNDRYFHDVAAAIERSSTPGVLRRGHLEFAQARAAERKIDHPAAALHYEAATKLLRQAGSPQWLLARIGRIANNVLQTNDYDAEIRELDDVATQARSYPVVIAFIDLNRLFPEQFSSHYDKSLASYQSVKSEYARLRDWEDQISAATHGIGTMTVAGLDDAAWQETFLTMRDAPRIASWKTWFLLNGAAADAALRLQHPEAAELYLSAMADAARRRNDSRYLAIALNHRAASEVRLQRYDDAQRDLDEVGRLLDQVNVALRKALEARVAEARGETALHRDADAAVAELTRAIAAADEQTEYATFRALLHAERAEAYSRLGKLVEAEADRREALQQLHAEEEGMLKERKPGKGDDLWNSYFSRFDQTYDLLIRQFINQGRVAEAFQYSERARAYEPLDLVRKLPSAPAGFRELATHADAVDIAALRRQLASGTFVIEYHVFEDGTYVWIFSRDQFAGRWLRARRRDVQRWTSVLQNAAIAKDSAAFDGGVDAPFDGLLRTPLDVIHRWPGGAAAKIVIVPDRELRGLPFHALRNPDTKRYLIEDHTVSFSGSALLYVFAVLRDRALASHDASALLVGDPAFDPDSLFAQGLGRLGNARREIADIAPLYKRSEILVDAMATPQEFLRRAGDNEVIHIAAHGVVNGNALSQSFLLFNGVLTAETLMNGLHTEKTRLVVLGSCSSAGGLPVGVEGIAPLVRPIVGAGVPGVIGALWSIDDATAARLLVSFHRHYREGKDAAEALRDAQVDMLQRDPALRSGRFWAPFQAIGYASSPFTPVGDIKKEKPP